VTAVEVSILPRSLTEAFLRNGDTCQAWGKLLRFLSPITITRGLESYIFR
jgi:hypothetical protein